MQKNFQGSSPDDQLIILEFEPELVMEKTYPANQRWEECGIPHLHPKQDEHFEILAGMLSVRVRDDERTYVTGESFTISRGIPHLVCNRGSKPVRTRWKVFPALNAAAFYENTYRLSKEGKLDNLLHRAVISWEYRDIFQPLSPPLWLQPFLLAPLAIIGRWMGIKIL